MSFQLPVIQYLRNPSLKQRHWMKIETLLTHKFKAEETVTLQLLESLQVFNYPNELMEVSGQASSEASLESLLRKVKSCTSSIYPSKLTNFRLKNHGKLLNLWSFLIGIQKTSSS